MRVKAFSGVALLLRLFNDCIIYADISILRAQSINSYTSFAFFTRLHNAMLREVTLRGTFPILRLMRATRSEHLCAGGGCREI